MISTEKTVEIAASIDKTWEYTSDIARWAELMPGLVDFEVFGDDDTRWTLKVGAGALVRTVKVAVHVDRWAGPERVDFSFQLEDDPADGGGSYTARPLDSQRTAMTLAVRVAGRGPQAPMWEAIGKSLLPALAQAFAGQLRDAIEQTCAPAADTERASLRQAEGSWLARLIGWLMRMLRHRRKRVSELRGDAS